MRKGLSTKQEGKLDDLKKTFPVYKLTSHLNLARLRLAKDFPYEQQSRLCREVTQNILQYFRDFQVVYHHLPLSYRLKIISDDSFNRCFTDDVIPTLKSKERKSKKPADKAESYESYVMSANLFTIGLENLINSMPTEFQSYLIREVTPLMQLMHSIASFYRKTTGKQDIPFPYTIPDTIPVRY